MPGFMEGYGVAEARRGRLILRLAIGALALLIVSAGSYFYFRTWSQERIIDRFLTTIESKDFDTAYAMWCSAANPCPYYPREKFLEDWGPSTPYANAGNAKVRYVDYCDNGVVFNFDWSPSPDVTLWVERSSGMISFAPWERCPGKHLQFSGFFDRLFGSSPR